MCRLLFQVSKYIKTKPQVGWSGRWTLSSRRFYETRPGAANTWVLDEADRKRFIRFWWAYKVVLSQTVSRGCPKKVWGSWEEGEEGRAWYRPQNLLQCFMRQWSEELTWVATQWHRLTSPLSTTNHWVFLHFCDGGKAVPLLFPRLSSILLSLYFF